MRITDSDPTQKEFLAGTTPARGKTGYEAAQLPFPPTPPALRRHSAGTPPALRRHSAALRRHSAGTPPGPAQMGLLGTRSPFSAELRNLRGGGDGHVVAVYAYPHSAGPGTNGAAGNSFPVFRRAKGGRKLAARRKKRGQRGSLFATYNSIGLRPAPLGEGAALYRGAGGAGPAGQAGAGSWAAAGPAVGTYSTIQHHTAPYNTIRHHTAPYSTIQRRTAAGPAVGWKWLFQNLVSGLPTGWSGPR
eukprot:gene21727-biopygen1131